MLSIGLDRRVPDNIADIIKHRAWYGWPVRRMVVNRIRDRLQPQYTYDIS